MNNPSKRRKLGAILAFVTLCSMAAVAYTSMGFLRTETQVERLIEQDQALAFALSQMLAQELQMGQALRGIVLDPDNETAHRNLENAAAEFSLLIDRALRLSVADQAATVMLREIEQLRDKQRPIQADVVAAAKHRPADAIAIIEHDETQVWDEIRQQLQNFSATKKADVQASMNAVKQISHTAVLTATALGGLALLVVLALVLYVSQLASRIGETLKVADQLKGERAAAGNVARHTA